MMHTAKLGFRHDIVWRKESNEVEKPRSNAWIVKVTPQRLLQIYDFGWLIEKDVRIKPLPGGIRCVDTGEILKEIPQHRGDGVNFFLRAPGTKRLDALMRNASFFQPAISYRRQAIINRIMVDAH
jgi:hypothetical protein